MGNYRSLSKVVRRRVALLVALIPILGTWYYLVFIVPFFGLGQLWRNNDGHSVTIANIADKFYFCDINAEQIRKVLPPSQGYGDPSRIYLIEEFRKQGKLYRRWKFDIVSDDSNQAAEEMVFDFPSKQRPYIIGQRFLVHAYLDSLQVADLRSKDREIQLHSIHAASKNGVLVPVGTTNRFLRGYSEVDFASRWSVATPMVFELYEIDSEGKPSLLNTWQATCSRYSTHHSMWNDQLITIHPIDHTLELRSTVDGHLISASPLPREFILGKDNFAFAGDRGSLGRHQQEDHPFLSCYLSINQGQKVFSLSDRRWIAIPKECDGFFSSSPNGALRLWEDKLDTNYRSHVVVVSDSQSDEIISRYRCDDGRHRACFIDDDTIACLSMPWGYTFRTVSARTGVLLKTWRPYWMVFPILLLSSPAYMMWCVAWLRSADPGSRWLWIDIAIVSGLPVATFVLRMRIAGGTLDFERMPIAISQGIFVSLIFLSCIWLWNSRKRLVPRLLPIMLVHACLANAIASVFPIQLTKGPTVLFPSLVLTGTLFIVCVTFKLCGYRFTSTNTLSESKGWSISLREALVLIAVSAILFASWQRLIGELRFLDPRLNDLRFFALLTFVPPIAFLSSLSRNRHLHGLGQIASMLAFGYLLFDALVQFVGWQDRYRGMPDGLAYVVLSTFVSTFILSKAFRRRDWLLSRLRSDDKILAPLDSLKSPVLT